MKGSITLANIEHISRKCCLKAEELCEYIKGDVRH